MGRSVTTVGDVVTVGGVGVGGVGGCEVGGGEVGGGGEMLVGRVVVLCGTSVAIVGTASESCNIVTNRYFIRPHITGTLA